MVNGLTYQATKWITIMMKIYIFILLINELPNSRYKDKYIIGTGLNSLADNINLMKISKSMGFFKFLIMPFII